MVESAVLEGGIAVSEHEPWKWRLRIAVTLLALGLLVGCWDRKELNELAIVVAIGLDRSPEGYQATAQVIDPSTMQRKGGGGGGSRSPTILYTDSSETMEEALRKTTKKISRRFNYAHLMILVLSEELAREGINEVMDTSFRSTEARPEYYVAIARGMSARELMGIMTPFEVIPPLDFSRSLENSHQAWAPTAAISIADVARALKEEGREPVLSGIRIIGDDEKAKEEENVKQPTSLAEYQYHGLGIFKGDKLLGWLNEEDSKAYNYITNGVDVTTAHFECPGGLLGVNVTQARTKLQPVIVDGKPVMKVQVRLESTIVQSNCEVDLGKVEQLRKLEAAGAERANQILMEGIRTVQQQFGSDIFGFGEAFHKKYPKEWKQWKKDWDHMFSEMEVELTVDYYIRKLGQINRTFRKVS